MKIVEKYIEAIKIFTDYGYRPTKGFFFQQYLN